MEQLSLPPYQADRQSIPNENTVRARLIAIIALVFVAQSLFYFYINPPLLQAAYMGKTGAVRWLIEKGADVNTAGKRHGFTALMRAAQKGHTDTARLLLERGANINATAQNGSTALMEAALFGHADTVRLLIERGADLEAMARSGRTALARAECRGYADIVQILKDAGAKEVNTDVNANCNAGSSSRQ